MTDKNKITPEDRELFRQAVKGSKKIKHDKVTPTKPKTKLPPVKLQPDQPSPSLHFDPEFVNNPVTPEETLFFNRGGLQHKVVKRLRQGQLSIEKSLDLHGLTTQEADQALTQFIHQCQQQGYRNLLIIHGKGQRANHQMPILKNFVNQWLRQHPAILAFSSSQAKHGGTGSVYVMLRTL